jgi:hypothetical protein
MPLMDGRALIERLLPDRPTMKVLCFSGYAEQDQLPPGIEQGLIGFLPKPFTPSVLAARVRALLDSPKPTGNP